MTHHGNVAMSCPRRRRLSAAAVGTAVALVVAGCGAGEPVTGEALSAEGPVSITWYGSDARNAAVQAVVDGFAAQHPDTVIESQPTAFDPDWDRLSVQAAGHNMAFLAAVQARYEARYQDRGALVALGGL